MKKRISWAYATSTHADKYKCPEGCYVIEDATPLIPKDVDGGFLSWAGAKAAADELPGEYDKYSMDEPRHRE